jgi:hypothetical protein
MYSISIYILSIGLLNIQYMSRKYLKTLQIKKFVFISFLFGLSLELTFLFYSQISLGKFGIRNLKEKNCIDISAWCSGR